MNLLKKITALFLVSIAMLPSIWADETIDNALVDIIYEAIDGKKIVIYDSSVPLYKELENKIKDFESNTLLLDSQLITGLYNNYQQTNLSKIEKLDNFQLYLTSLIDPTGFIAQFIDIYGENNIGLLQNPSQLYVRDYIPTVQNFTFVPIKKDKLTKEFLDETVIQFNEFVKKYEEATISLKTDSNGNKERSKIDLAVRFHISNFANILAWNATLIEEYETAGKLYNRSITYAQNIPSLLSIASLSKEGKLKNINKEAVEKDLITMTTMAENEPFLMLGFNVFYNGFIYGPQYYYDIKWDWVIFGIPQNSPSFAEAFNKISDANKRTFIEKAIPPSREPSTIELTKKAKKYNLPENISSFTSGNYFTLYSLIRNRNDENGRIAKDCLLNKINNIKDKSKLLTTRIVIEKSILYKETIFLQKATQDYLNEFEYNRQVAIAALLANSRLMDVSTQVELLTKTMSEEGEQTPEWVSLMKDAITTLTNNDVNGFNKGCYNAIKSYKGTDTITLGYLYNVYAFSKLMLGGIKNPQKEDINFIDLIEGKIINKELLIEADVVEYAIGSYLLQKGEIDKASKYLFSAYDKNKYSQFYLNDLVVALTENGEYELGRDALKKHDETIQNLNTSSLDTLAICIVRANPNDAKEALEVLIKAFNLLAEDEEVPLELYLHFAEIYNILDQQDKAKKYLNKFLEKPLVRPLLNSDKEVLEQLKKALNP